MPEHPARRRVRRMLAAIVWLPLMVVSCADVLGIRDKERRPDGVVSTSERCTNDLDDDGDGATDCADPDCAEYLCAPPAPPQWQGPVSLSYDTEDVSCPIGQVEVLFGGSGDPVVPPANCAPCQCTPSQSCDATLELSTNPDCDNSSFNFQVTQDECEPPSTTSAWAGRTMHNNDPYQPCTPSGGEEQPPHPPITFESTSRACQSPAGGGGCGAGQLCMARPAQPFVGPCVYRLGEEACPDEYYSRLMPVTAATADDRGCTACSCPETDCSGGWVDLYNDFDCSGTPVGTVPLDGSCAQLGSFGPLEFQTAMLHADACPAEGGEGTTDITRSVMTFCCVP